MTSRASESELAELLQRALSAQDREAFDRLFASQRGRIEVLLQARIPAAARARVDVDDVIQETYMRAFRRLARMPGMPPDVFRRWIVHIALRELRRVYERHLGAQKRDARQDRHVEDAGQLRADGIGTPSRLVARRESVEILADALQALPEDYREVILLRDFHELPVATVALRLGRTSRAVEMLYHRAMLRLSEVVTTRGLSASRY